MIKQFITFFIFIITIVSCAQSKSEETVKDVIVNNKGKIISKETISNYKKKPFTAEEILTKFYNNQKDIDELEELISFRFYQKTPYIKFKEIMELKNNLCGEFISKKILETEYSDDKKAVFLNYK